MGVKEKDMKELCVKVFGDQEEKICKTCKHFRSYYEIYEFDEFEPCDMGECHRGKYPYPSDKCGIGWENSCEDWEKEKKIEKNKG